MEAATLGSISKFSAIGESIEEQVDFSLDDPFAALLEVTMAGSFLMFVDGGDILIQCVGLLYSHSGYRIGEEILLQSGGTLHSKGWLKTSFLFIIS
jgi:hypothetical protein